MTPIRWISLLLLIATALMWFAIGIMRPDLRVLLYCLAGLAAGGVGLCVVTVIGERR